MVRRLSTTSRREPSEERVRKSVDLIMRKAKLS